MGADNNHRQLVPPHDLLKHFQTAHAGHLEIESYHLGLQIVDFFQAEVSVHGGADYLDGSVSLDNLWNQLPHERGIIDDQDAHR